MKTYRKNTSEVIERAFIRTDLSKPPDLLVDLQGLYIWKNETMSWELITSNVRLISEKDPTFIKEL